MYGSNPFDRHLSAKTKQKMQVLKAAQSFQEAQAVIHETIEESFKLSDLHSGEWKRHQERQHAVRREEAEAAAPVEIRNRLLVDQEEQDAADDKRFDWIRCADQLLQVRGHEEFLRASRDWERRCQLAKETGKPIPQPWTSGRIWGIGTLVFFGMLILAAAKESILGALLLTCIGIPIWAILARLPELIGDFGTSGGGRGGGNAV